MSAQQQRLKVLLEQCIARYKQLSDSAMWDKVMAQVQSFSVPVDAGPLGEQTVKGYRSAANILCRALLAKERTKYPPMAEIILRAHMGPMIVTELLPVCSERRKVGVVMCTAVSRGFPELSNGERSAFKQAWNGVLRGARAEYEKQRRLNQGFGGIMDDLPSMQKITITITSWPLKGGARTEPT